MTKDKIIPLDEVLTLMLAGNFTFTATSLKTNEHLTFNVKLDDKDEEHYTWIVSILIAPNEYKKIGELHFNEKVDFEPVIYHKQRSVISFQAILHVLKGVKEGMIDFRSMGKCAKCGRPLTTDESIEKGIGPECEKKHKEFITSLIT